MLLAGALALTAAFVGAGGARLAAEPLAAEACERLRQEKAELANAGVPANMSKGPEWAKANLAAAKLSEIERFIDVEEALLFRCVRPLPPEVQKAIEAEAAPPPPPAPPKARQKAAAPNPASNGATAAGTGDGDASTAPPAAAPKPQVRRPPRPKAAPAEPPPQPALAPQ